jgi:hypothetical protein
MLQIIDFMRNSFVVSTFVLCDPHGVRQLWLDFPYALHAGPIIQHRLAS